MDIDKQWDFSVIRSSLVLIKGSKGERITLRNLMRDMQGVPYSIVHTNVGLLCGTGIVTITQVNFDFPLDAVIQITQRGEYLLQYLDDEQFCRKMYEQASRGEDEKLSFFDACKECGFFGQPY